MLARYCEWKNRKWILQELTTFMLYRSIELILDAAISKMETAQQESRSYRKPFKRLAVSLLISMGDSKRYK